MKPNTLHTAYIQSKSSSEASPTIWSHDSLIHFFRNSFLTRSKTQKNLHLHNENVGLASLLVKLKLNKYTRYHCPQWKN